MAERSYNQFCPLAMAAQILCGRWTLLILRELFMGSGRFNDLRRGLPRISPALLSSRLKELEAAGVVARAAAGRREGVEYRLTEAGRELFPIVQGVGAWGQRWVSTEATLKSLDADLLMWDIRRNINPEPRPARRTTIQFAFPDAPKAQQTYWLVLAPGEEPDLCKIDPGFEVDLWVVADLRTMTEVWLGYTRLQAAKDEGRLTLAGDRWAERSLSAWLKLSMLAQVEKQVT